MKENKNKVMRVTEREERLLNYLRYKSGTLVEELKEVRYKLGGYELIGDMVALIEDRQLIDMDKLISQEFINIKDAEILIEAMETNKNILIVGRSGVGKTTLMNALIEYQKNVAMHVVESRPEVYISERLQENSELKTHITKESKDSVDMGDITKLVNTSGYKYKRMIISEMVGLESLVALSMVVSIGISVLATSQINIIEGCKKGFEGVKLNIKENLAKHEFVIVEVGMEVAGESRKRKVISITGG